MGAIVILKQRIKSVPLSPTGQRTQKHVEEQKLPTAWMVYLSFHRTPLQTPIPLEKQRGIVTVSGSWALVRSRRPDGGHRWRMSSSSQPHGSDILSQLCM